jgi:hypothetical protein
MTTDQQEAARILERRANEKAIEDHIRAYICDPSAGKYKRYHYGDLINLISTIRKICEELHEDIDSNSGVTEHDVEALRACETALDVSVPA